MKTNQNVHGDFCSFLFCTFPLSGFQIVCWFKIQPATTYYAPLFAIHRFFSANFSSFNPTTYIGTVKISKMKIVSFCIFWFKLVSGLLQTSVYSSAQVCIIYDEVSRKANNGETNANKLITRPIMTTHQTHHTLPWPIPNWGLTVFSTTRTPYHGHNCPYILKVGWFSCPVRNYSKIPGFPQPNFTKWLWFLAIFQLLWKILKPQYFCTVWPVEIRD